APLSTNRRAGAASAAVGRWRLGNEGLREIAIELLATVARQPVDQAARRQQGVCLRRPRQGAHRGPDCLGLRPSAALGPGFELLEIRLVQNDLKLSASEC